MIDRKIAAAMVGPQTQPPAPLFGLAKPVDNGPQTQPPVMMEQAAPLQMRMRQPMPRQALPVIGQGGALQ